MAKISINLEKGSVNKQSDIIVGIDLGTTNSLVAYMKDGAPTAVRDVKGRHALVPSIVHFDEQGAIVVGEKAREKLVTQPERTIYSVKRLLGKSFQDVEGFQQYFG